MVWPDPWPPALRQKPAPQVSSSCQQRRKGTACPLTVRVDGGSIRADRDHGLLAAAWAAVSCSIVRSGHLPLKPG